MPFAILPALQWLGGSIWSFTSSTLGQFAIVFAVAWFWSAHHTNFQWETRVAAENAAREAAYHAEVIRQQEAAREITAAATARADENALLAYKLKNQIDEFNAQETKSEQSIKISCPKVRYNCRVDDDFAGVVRNLDASAGKGKASRRTR